MSTNGLFELGEDELELVKSKKTNKNRLGFAILLKYFQLEGHYPSHIKFIDPFMLNSIANQINISPSCIDHFDWEGRSTERFRNEIRKFLGYKQATSQDINKLKAWLIKEIFPKAVKSTEWVEYAYLYFRERQIEPITSGELERHTRSAHYKFEQRLFKDIDSMIPNNTKEMMDRLLADDTEDEENCDENDKRTENIVDIKFNQLKGDIPSTKLKDVNHGVQKINCLKQLKLPNEYLDDLSPKLIYKYCLRVMAELPGSMRDHKPMIRYATFSLFCFFRSQFLIDNLADVLTKLTHKIQTNAEQHIDKKILSEVKRVNGKFDILYSLSYIALTKPTGIIQKTIYPEVGKDTLNNLVKELNYKGKWYENQVHIKMRSLYSHSHRKTLLTLLDNLIFKTNIKESKRLLEAIEIIRSFRDISGKYFPASITVPIDDVVPNEWRSLVVEVIEKDGGDRQVKRINRINYELAVLKELRKQLGCKMIWIEGAFRYRDPDRDLPKDFDEKREYYFDMLELPKCAQEFISSSKKKLHQNLTSLNDSMLDNKKVKITNRNGGHIKISPYKPQAEPTNIKNLHQTIKQEWVTINLIDILKEADLQIGFTNLFHTVASRENIPRDVLQFRLLLCLYAIGTNAGLKPISSANDDANYSNLRYTKRRYITIESVRLAIVKVVNKILAIRDPRIWGEATTGVACDSKKLNVWDQNLMAEWHARYKGRGVMVYWHVEKKALCIYSQLKTCSSSEVGSMIKDILRHCTNMEVNQAYVDTHGQSTLAFGVSELLKFDLLPRLKNIHAQKLYYPASSCKGEYENLQKILKNSINWKLIEDYYDEAVKHIVALKLGTMDPDVFVKRFSKDNYQHPVFKAIIEIGKVAKTNFLCRYLIFEELRIEIHEAQNVVERLNSIMGFIFYGKLGEISTNIKNDQELAIVCLHLLQACMAYINTLIFQNVLSRPEWNNKLTVEDKRALNVLFHSHINPYGLFPLDLTTRLGIFADDVNADDDNSRKSSSSKAAQKQIDEELV